MSTLTGIRDRANSSKVYSPFDRIIMGQITQVLPESGQVVVTFLDTAGHRTLPLLHPFFTANGWHRVMPEPLSYVLIGFRSASSTRAEIIKYCEPDEGARLAHRSQKFQGVPLQSPWARPQNKDEFFPMRVLGETEQEIRTRGDAGIWMSVRGQTMLHGGPLMFRLEKDDMEAVLDSPVFKHRIIKNRYSNMDDMIQVGVVERPNKDAKLRDSWKQYVKAQGDEGKNQFTREWYGKLNWKGKPNALWLEQIGHVINLHQEWIKHSTAGTRVRKSTTMSTDLGPDGAQEGEEKVFGWQYGVFGDVHFYLPEHKDHKHGWQVDIPDKKHGNFVRRIGVDEVAAVGVDMRYQIGRDHHSKIGRDHTTMVGGNLTSDVGKRRFDQVGELWRMTAGSKMVLYSPVIWLGDPEMGDVNVTVVGNLDVTGTLRANVVVAPP